MANWKIYHNPRCSKSREALALLQDRKVEPQVIEYLKERLSETELRSLVSKLTMPASALVRVKEDTYKSLKFDLDSVDEIVRNLAAHPELIERPIVVKDNKAIVARPIERIEELF